MNKEELKKLAEEEFINNTMKHLDSALIFTYIQNLEKENQQLKENYDRIYNENCKLREEHNITDISLLDENQQLKEMQCPFLGTGCKRELEKLKKQKDDVVEYINYYGITPEQNDNTILRHILKDLLRMLGEIDD